MRLPRLLRTTSFRFTLLYAALFCASVLLLFGAMFWYGSGYVASEIDRTTADEITEVRQAASGHGRGNGLERLRDAVAAYTRNTPPGVFYYLQDRDGRVLAGNVKRLAPVEGLRNWGEDQSDDVFPNAPHGVRGRGVRVDEGAYLFVGLDAFELIEMREMIAQAFIWGLLGTVLLSLAGGALMSLSLLRRVEAISETSREIVAGDLARRIPVQGNDDEFDHLAGSLNAMLDRIEGLMAGLRQVSSDIAHDLRTPLTRLRQRLELARWRGRTVEELQETLDSSIADLDAALETFAALLRIAQIEARTKATEFAPLDLSEMLFNMLDTYQSVAEENGRTLTGDIAPGLVVTGDRELLPQLFSNLIENAIRHAPEGSSIVLGARAGEVWVADNGPGIPEDMRDKVFQRFFRLERSRTTQGTGLGLSLAGAIAALHNAFIDLSDNGPGLTARVVF